MLHSACTIHLLNLPEKTARRDIIHGVKHLEEIAEDWLCARRTLSILSVLARKWKCELPDEAAVVLQRTDEKYGYLVTTDVPSPNRSIPSHFTPSPPSFPQSPAQEKSTNLDQRLATRMAQDIAGTLQTEFLTSMGGIGPAGMQSLDLTPASNANQNPTSIAFDPNTTWAAMSGISQPALPRYYQAYPAVQQGQQGGSSSGPTTVASSRQRTPAPPFALDGKDWYLKDGVNWQQNFEGWGLGANPTNNSAASNQITNNNNNNDNTGGGVADLSGGDMFMFKGLQGGDEMNIGDGWDFDSSMTNLDLLPGLD